MQIYHLHIPRTGGVGIRDSIIPTLISNNKKVFASNRSVIDPFSFQNTDFISGHFSRTPIDYMKDPEIFTVVREPVSRWISYFKYTTGVHRTDNDIKEKLENWLYGEQSEIQSNMQSKMLTGVLDIEKFNSGANVFKYKVDNGWFVKDYNLDYEHIINTINSYRIYSFDKINNFIFDVASTFKKQFNVDVKIPRKTNECRNIDLHLTKSQINKIKELNQIDTEIYEYVKSKE